MRGISKLLAAVMIWTADSFPLKMEINDNPDLKFDTAAFSKRKLYGRQ